MSYYNAVRQAGTCINGECEENDYLYDAPHLSPGIPCTVKGTSYCEIEQKASALKGPDDGLVRLAPDAWEDRVLSVAA